MHKGLIVTLTLLFISFYMTIPVGATIEYVDDCLENPENCEEPVEEDQGIELNDSDSGFLIESDNSSSLFLEIVKLIFALLLVLALIYLFLYFLKRRNKLGGNINSLENIGGISIGQNKTIQLVRLADRLYIVGVGEDITLLDEIKDQALIDLIMKEKESQGQEFSALPFVSSLFNKKDKKETEEDNPFRNLFQKEMESLQKNRKDIYNKRKEDQNE